MITSNPFSDIATLIPPAVMQGYVVLMFLLVVGGTILDTVHKKSAKYFFEVAKTAKKRATRTVGTGEKVSLAVGTLTSEVLTSSEFNNQKRRMSHLLTMYGFIIFVVTTAILIFSYTGGDAQAPGIVPLLWHLGALMLAVGGYWFWFFIRVDVFAEGNKWYQLQQRDMFIVSLLAMSTFALLWSFTGSLLMFALFIAASTFLFSTVLWSKFAHMFFKPAAAYQKKVAWADGSRENLPFIPENRNDPETLAKFPDLKTYMGDAPLSMGLGIKRETPNHH